MLIEMPIAPKKIKKTRDGNIPALDLGTSTGWALRRSDGIVVSGVATFRPGRYEGGGMRFLRLAQWLDSLDVPAAIYFEEVRRYRGVDAAHCLAACWRR